jgi:16S rRNA C967 or C1407 C5-methylase (RsmB/RsmF family)
MGRFQKRRKGGKKDRDSGGKKPASNQEKGDSYVATIVDEGNFRMELYYASQGIHSSRWNTNNELVQCNSHAEKEAERLLWRSVATKTLPASFRIAKDVPAILRVRLESELESMLEASHKREEKREVTNKLGFLPHAYQLEIDRTTIRKNPDLAALHEWLKQQTLSGYITRQEAVSMVPPVVLSPQPCDRVLDMCAAPGSKTCQLLEVLGPTGCIVANDANSKRAQ